MKKILRGNHICILLILSICIFSASQSMGCTTPTGLTTTNITSSSAKLNWGAVTGALSYTAKYRITGTYTWTSLVVTSNTVTLSGLSTGTSYDWKVLTTCSAANSTYSGILVFNTLCGVPTGLSTSNITSTSATLNWATTPSDSFLLRYYVTSAPNTVFFKTIKPGTTTSASLTGLAAGTNYSWLIRTYCMNGQGGSYSSTSSFTTSNGSCTAPSGLNASSITSSGAVLSWSAAPGALSYNIQYKISGASSWTSTTSTSTSRTLSGLSPATAYQFQVQTVCSSGASSWTATAAFTTANSTSLPLPDHVVILIEENHAYSQIIGSSSAPYINALANDAMSASFTQMYGIEHPSQPNYLDLFSGGNQGVTNNNLPASHFTTPNLARELINAGKTFITYSQTLPSVGYDGASSGKYMRKHNPVTNWMGTGTNQVSSTLNQPFTSFPSNYTTLPTVSFVVPNLDYDMHDGTISAGDTWFHTYLDGYVQWAKTHNSLFIIVFDEDDGNNNNRVACIFTGPMVKPGTISTTYNHYNLLRTIEDMFGTTHAGNAANAAPIHGCWLNGYKTTLAETGTAGFPMHIFPNPTSDVINIDYELNQSVNVSFVIYNNLGQDIYHQNASEEGEGSHQITLSAAALGMTKGIYFVEMLAGEQKVLKKLAIVE